MLVTLVLLGSGMSCGSQFTATTLQLALTRDIMGERFFRWMWIKKRKERERERRGKEGAIRDVQ